jgi:hypothetical protein
MNVDDLRIPLEALAYKLSTLKVRVYHTHRSRYSQNHNKCFETDIREQVEAVLAGIADPVLESHIRHMEVQRAKL